MSAEQVTGVLGTNTKTGEGGFLRALAAMTEDAYHLIKK